jgi:hypothetical protein
MRGVKHLTGNKNNKQARCQACQTPTQIPVYGLEPPFLQPGNKTTTFSFPAGKLFGQTGFNARSKKRGRFNGLLLAGEYPYRFIEVFTCVTNNFFGGSQWPTI